MKLTLDEKIKHRLVGIAVLLSIGIMIIPAILKKSITDAIEKVSLTELNKDIKLPKIMTDIECIHEDDPTLIDKSDFLVDICEIAVKKQGFQPRIDQTYGATDAPRFNAAGIQTITNLGPGDQAYSHKPNERLKKANVLKAVEIYKTIIEEYLK